MTPEEIANTPFYTPNLDIMGSSLEGVDFSKIDPSFFQISGDLAQQIKDYTDSQRTPADNIYLQLLGQANNLGTLKSFQTGAAGTKEGGLGSVDAVMGDMAKRLSDAGLTSIEQLGHGPIKESVTVKPEFKYSGWLGSQSTPKNPNNIAVPQFDGESGYLSHYLEFAPTGKWYREEMVGNDEAGYLPVKVPVSDGDVKNLNLTGSQPQEVELNLGATGYINKETGEPLSSLTGYDGRGWSGTSAGDGQTIYNVQFDATTGLPIFYNQQKHGRDDYADLLKIAAIGTAIFAPQIGAALLPAGSSAAAALAVGSAVSGFIGSGGNLEAGIKAGLAGYLGGKAGSWASKAANSALVGNIASNMTRTAILGGNM
jgi:hypothetical protein